MSIIHFLHQEPFELRDFYPSTVQFEDAGLLHPVEGPRHVQTAVVDLLGEAFHQDMEGLGACGIEGVLEEKAHDALPERQGTTAPLHLYQFLTLRGEVVHQIQTEHEEVLGEPHHLLLVEGEEIGIRQGVEVVGVALIIAEDALLLEDVRRRHLFDNRIAAVVAEGFDLQRAVDEEIQVGTGIAGVDDLSSGCHFLESEAGMACHNLQIVTAHTLKKRELEQSVVYLQDGHYSSILLRREGENHTAMSPWPSS